MNRANLIAAIEAHAKRRGIAPATVTSRAVANSRLYGRLVEGGDCTMAVAQRIIDYIAAHEAQADQKGAA